MKFSMKFRKYVCGGIRSMKKITFFTFLHVYFLPWRDIIPQLIMWVFQSFVLCSTTTNLITSLGMQCCWYEKKLEKSDPKQTTVFLKSRPIFTKKQIWENIPVSHIIGQFLRREIFAWTNSCMDLFSPIEFFIFCVDLFLEFYIFRLFRDPIFRYNYCILIVFGGKNMKSRLEVQKEDQKQTKIAKTSA